MFQFAGFPSYRLFIHLLIPKHYFRRVSPFGYLRLDGYLLLGAAFRSLSRPSSAPSAKAFTLCPFLLDLLSVFLSRWNVLQAIWPFRFCFDFCLDFYLCFFAFLDFVSFLCLFGFLLLGFLCSLPPFGVNLLRLMVENKRIELLTPCVQGRCSPSWANSP